MESSRERKCSFFIIVSLLLLQGGCSGPTSCTNEPALGPEISSPELQKILEVLDKSNLNFANQKLDEFVEGNLTLHTQIDAEVLEILSTFLMEIDEMIRNGVQQNNKVLLTETPPSESYKRIQRAIDTLSKELQGIEEEKEKLERFFTSYINREVQKGLENDRKILIAATNPELTQDTKFFPATNPELPRDTEFFPAMNSDLPRERELRPEVQTKSLIPAAIIGKEQSSSVAMGNPQERKNDAPTETIFPQSRNIVSTRSKDYLKAPIGGARKKNTHVQRESHLIPRSYQAPFADLRSIAPSSTRENIKNTSSRWNGDMKNLKITEQEKIQEIFSQTIQKVLLKAG